MHLGVLGNIYVSQTEQFTYIQVRQVAITTNIIIYAVSSCQNLSHGRTGRKIIHNFSKHKLRVTLRGKRSKSSDFGMLLLYKYTCRYYPVNRVVGVSQSLSRRIRYRFCFVSEHNLVLNLNNTISN